MSATLTPKPPMYGDARRWVLVQADSLEFLSELPESSVDALITDPPYGIGITGEAWDGGKLTDAAEFQRWTTAWASESLRVLKPGAWLAAFGAPRTFHRLVSGVEEAGFDVRDQVLWLYGQGVPKGHRRPDGLSTSLKPAYEPILLARKPLEGRTLDVNLTAYGTGALQIDAARVPRHSGDQPGFWPANIAFSHRSRCRRERCQPDCPAALIDRDRLPGGGISRLFYTPKANRREREAGCEGLPQQEIPIYPHSGPVRLVRNTHPTVKPLELMRWLTRMLCPPGGTVLDPFAGSGSTGAACVQDDRLFLGIERDERYVPIACARITYWAATAAQEQELP